MHLHTKFVKTHHKMVKVETSKEKDMGIRLGVEQKESSSYLEYIFLKNSLFMHYFHN